MVAYLILSRRLGSEIAILGYSGEELLPVSSHAVKPHIFWYVLVANSRRARASISFQYLFSVKISLTYTFKCTFSLYPIALNIVALMLDVVTWCARHRIYPDNLASPHVRVHNLAIVPNPYLYDHSPIITLGLIQWALSVTITRSYSFRIDCVHLSKLRIPLNHHVANSDDTHWNATTDSSFGMCWACYSDLPQSRC